MAGWARCPDRDRDSIHNCVKRGHGICTEARSTGVDCVQTRWSVFRGFLTFGLAEWPVRYSLLELGRPKCPLSSPLQQLVPIDTAGPSLWTGGRNGLNLPQCGFSALGPGGATVLLFFSCVSWTGATNEKVGFGTGFGGGGRQPGRLLRRQEPGSGHHQGLIWPSKAEIKGHP